MNALFNSIVPSVSDTLILNGDTRDLLKFIPSNSVDSAVIDPPYELKIAGSSWDNTGVAYDVNVWREVFRVLKPGARILAFSHGKTYHRFAPQLEAAGFEVLPLMSWLYATGFPKKRTELKQANEPIFFGCKPFEGTIEQNQSEYGIGFLNIDENRIGEGEFRVIYRKAHQKKSPSHLTAGWRGGADKIVRGKYPSNVFVDETMAALPNLSHFFCAKPSRYDRGEGNDHPTVKPISLLTHLIRLVTPKGGVVLDAFMGSGSTGVAAVISGFGFIGIEQDPRYVGIAVQRLMKAREPVNNLVDMKKKTG